MRAIICVAALTLLTAVADAHSASAPTSSTVIHAGWLLADPGTGLVKKTQTIVVRGAEIEAIKDGFVTEPGASVIELRDACVLPGLIDCHVHLSLEECQNTPLDDVTIDSARQALRAEVYASKTLHAGFTTVADLGTESDLAIFALRDAIAAGEIAGPRIIAAGNAITAHGGHGDVQGFRPDVMHVLTYSNACSGADDCRRATRQEIQKSADIVKVLATGGVYANTRTGVGQQLTDDELKAIVDAAHSLGRRATAHAHGADGTNAALGVGMNSIEHGTYLDDESIRLFLAHDAYPIPTFMAGETVARDAADPANHMMPAQREKAAKVGPQMICQRGRLMRPA